MLYYKSHALPRQNVASTSRLGSEISVKTELSLFTDNKAKATLTIMKQMESEIHQGWWKKQRPGLSAHIARVP